MNAWHGGLAGVGVVALVIGAGLLAPDPDAPPAGPAPQAAPVASRSTAPLVATPPARVPLPGAVPANPPAPAPEVDRLVAAARRGDARASYAAYQALSACVAAEATACPGLPASLLAERLRFLAEAVRAGLPAAQVDFYMEGPDRLQALDEQALQAWRAQALAGLQAASAHCEPLATGLLATLYESGELAPRDAARALAYAVAEGALRRHPATDTTLLDRLAEPVDEATLAAARVQGLALAAACRAEPQG